MRRRLLAIHLGLLAVLVLAGCQSPSVEACPVCDFESDSRNELLTEYRDSAVNSTSATLTVTRNGTVRWTSVNDVDLGANQSFASPATVADRLRARFQTVEWFEGTIESVSVRYPGGDRVVVTAVVDGTVTTGPGGVVIYEGFDLPEGSPESYVNAHSLTVEGPGPAVYVTSGAGDRRGNTVHYTEYQDIPPDTQVVFGLEEGVTGSLLLRGAFAAANDERLPEAIALSLLPVLLVAGGLAVFERTIDLRVTEAGQLEDPTVPFLLLAVSLLLGLLGWWAGVAPIAGVAFGFGSGVAVLATATRFGVRSSRIVAPAAFCGVVAGAGLWGWLLGTLTGHVGSLWRTPLTGPPLVIATPSALGLDFAVWATLVAAPMAVGSVGVLDERNVLDDWKIVAWFVAGATPVSLVLLGWVWPVFAPIEYGMLVYVAPAVFTSAALVVIPSYVGGLALSERGADGNSPQGGADPPAVEK